MALTGSNSPDNSIAISDAERYSRQVLFAPIGEEGQRQIGRAHVGVIGVGATGAAAAALLARAGVGTLTIVDRDFVEASNLQRQVLFTEADATEALPKAEAARRHIAEFNRSVTVKAHIADLTPSNITELLGGADILLDATDNFETRYLLNDFAVANAKPWIYTAAIGSYAATMNILPQETAGAARTACLACVFPDPPTGAVETCDTAGILNTAVNLAASLAVTEALKFASGNAKAMRRTLLSFDLWTGDRAEISAAEPNPACPTCGARRFPHLAGEGRPQITLCGRNSVQIHEHARPLHFDSLAAQLSKLGTVRYNEMLLRFQHETYTLSVFPDGRALIQGTTDTALARSLYARFIGS